VDRPKSKLVPHRDSEAVVSQGKKVLDFPLSAGKTWSYEYMEMPRHSGDKVTYQNTSRVLACEQVSTPAGKFSAFKIEVEQSSPSFRSTGVYHLWYAPEVKNFVKRHYVPSDWWSGGVWMDNDLVRFEVK
jgi:hypothetical protein